MESSNVDMLLVVGDLKFLSLRCKEAYLRELHYISYPKS